MGQIKDNLKNQINRDSKRINPKLSNLVILPATHYRSVPCLDDLLKFADLGTEHFGHSRCSVVSTRPNLDQIVVV